MDRAIGPLSSLTERSLFKAYDQGTGFIARGLQVIHVAGMRISKQPLVAANGMP